MSSESETETERTGLLSDRETALIVVTGATALVVGIWIGLWSVPDAALDVPTETRSVYGGGTVVDARYQPAPDWLPLTIALPIGAVVWSLARLNVIGDRPEDVDDDHEVSEQ